MSGTGIVCWVGVSLSLLGAVGARLERLPADCPAVRQWFEEQELLDRGEPQHCLSHLLWRYRTCSHLPRLSLLDRYPSEQWLDEQIKFANGHIEYLERQRELATSAARQQYLDEWIEEANWLRELYRELSWAACHRDWSRRCAETDWSRALLGRNRLETVQRMIGKEALEQGLLPPVVPLWRFQRVR